MSINENHMNEEIEFVLEAAKSKNSMRLQELSNSFYTNVRKAVARNSNTSKQVINHMAQTEKASSVLYWLLKNPTCSSTRAICEEDLSHKCVTCEISELNLYKECVTCNK